MAISFWKENVLLAVTLGEEPGAGFSSILMFFILSTSVASVGPSSLKVSRGRPHELRHLCGPALLTLRTQACQSAGSYCMAGILLPDVLQARSPADTV